MLELAAAELRQAGHRADREVRRLGVDQVDLRPLRQKVDDDLLRGFLPGAGVEGAEVLGLRIDRQHAFREGGGPSGVDLGVVRPAELDHDDRLVRMRFLPGRRHLLAHLERHAGFVAARGRDAGVGDRAEERGHDDALVEGFLDAGLGGLGIPDMQRRRVEAAGNDLVDVLRHHRRIRLAIEDDDLGAVLLLGVALGFGRLRLVEHVRQVGHEESDPLCVRSQRAGARHRHERRGKEHRDKSLPLHYSSPLMRTALALFLSIDADVDLNEGSAPRHRRRPPSPKEDRSRSLTAGSANVA